MSAEAATHEPQPDESTPFSDHDFGGEAAAGASPDHVEPYASRDDGGPRTSPVAIPDQVDPYSSRG